MTLTQKETDFLNDFKSQEQLCIDKYTKYAGEACSSCLKNLFSSMAQADQTHLDTVTQMLNGQEPQPQPAPSATQAVCNDNSCSPLHQTVHSFLNNSFSSGINTRCCFI